MRNTKKGSRGLVGALGEFGAVLGGLGCWAQAVGSARDPGGFEHANCLLRPSSGNLGRSREAFWGCLVALRIVCVALYYFLANLGCLSCASEPPKRGLYNS